MTNAQTFNNNANLIWSTADLLRGDYKQSEYGKVILPLTVIRRFDCVLEPTKEQVLKRYESIKGKVDNVEPISPLKLLFTWKMDISTIDSRADMGHPEQILWLGPPLDGTHSKVVNDALDMARNMLTTYSME